MPPFFCLKTRRRKWPSQDSSPGKPQPPLCQRCLIGNGCREGQLNFSARVATAPNLQLRAYDVGTFPHAGQAKVPNSSAYCLSADPSSIVTNSHSEFVRIIPNLYFD